MTNNLNSAQKEQLQETGLRLSQIRTARNISLDTVAAKTKIPQSLLLAIEEANFDELPEPFYIQALIGKYAQAVGATGIEFILAKPEASPTNERAQTKSRFQLSFQLRSLHLYLLYIVLVFISVRAISLMVERPVVVNETPAESLDLDPDVSQIKPELEAPKAQAVPQFVSQSSDANSVSVGINLQERCWLKVMVDGKVAFEGILPKGTQRKWSGEREVTIRAGNAGGVVISFNNEQQKVLGAPGQVEEITYTVN